MMRLESMRYFVEIAEAGSVSKISRKCAVPQQSLSSMLAALETELNCVLLQRSGGKLVLTEEGKAVYQYCTDFLAAYTALKRNLGPELKEFDTQNFLITAQDNISQTVFPNWLSKLLKYHPEFHVEIKIQSRKEIVEAVLAERVDAGFILLFEKDGKIFPELPDELKFVPLFFSRPYFWLNRNNPLAANKSVTMKVLNDDMIIKSEAADPELFEFIFSDCFQMRGNYLNAANPQIMLRMVQENLAICPDLKVDKGGWALGDLFAKDDNIVAIPLSAKDNYKVVTGYLLKEETLKKKPELITILKYL